MKYKVLVKYNPKSVVDYDPITALHTVNQELVKSPPENAVFKLVPESFTDRLLLAGTLYFHLPQMGFYFDKSVNLFHSRHELVLNNVNWVVDFEHVFALCWHRTNLFPFSKEIIKRRLYSKFCKKIMPWSFAAKRSLENFIDTSGIKDKIEVVYPAMGQINSKSKRKSNDRVRLLFIGRLFYEKGGREALKAFEVLDRKFDVELTMVSDVPEFYINKFEDNSRVRFYPPNISREIIFKDFFPKFDIFVMPTYADSFGFVLVEAKAFGLPIVSSDVFAVPEIVADGVDGFIIHSSLSYYDENYLIRWNRKEFTQYIITNEQKEIVSSLVGKLSTLIEDDKLRRGFGESGRKEIMNGKFSINERNKKLLKIYSEACER